MSYYQFIECNLTPRLTELNNMLSVTVIDTDGIDRLCDNVVSVLISGEEQFVPKSQKVVPGTASIHRHR